MRKLERSDSEETVVVENCTVKEVDWLVIMWIQRYSGKNVRWTIDSWKEFHLRALVILVTGFLGVVSEDIEEMVADEQNGVKAIYSKIDKLRLDVVSLWWSFERSKQVRTMVWVMFRNVKDSSRPLADDAIIPASLQCVAMSFSSFGRPSSYRNLEHIWLRFGQEKEISPTVRLVTYSSSWACRLGLYRRSKNAMILEDQPRTVRRLNIDRYRIDPLQL
jgi:hypothetical protein